MKSIDNIKKLIKIENDLIDNNDKLSPLVLKIKSIPSKGIFHILFLNELNIKGRYLEKLYYNCCKQNYNLFIVTLNMIEAGTFTIFDIFNNLNLDQPIPFLNSDIYDNNTYIFEPIFYNHLDKHPDFCKRQEELFKQNLMRVIKANKII